MTPNWHVDRSCVGAGTPLFNTCSTQPGAGSYPARPSYTATTVFTVTPLTDSITISGVFQHIGKTVSVVIGGLDCGDHLVSASGTVSVTYGTDPGGIFTEGWLITSSGVDPTNPAACPIDVTYADASTGTIVVEIVIGYTYTSQGQVLRPASEGAMKASQGGGVGQTRRVHMLGAQLTNTIGISFGTDFTAATLVAATLREGSEALDNSEMFTGVHETTIINDYSFDGQVAWQITRPVPAMVNAVTSFIETQER